MENGPFEDLFPIKDGDIPASYVSLPGGIYSKPSIRVPWPLSANIFHDV